MKSDKALRLGKAPLPSDEAARLEALRLLSDLDFDFDYDCQCIVALAAELLEAPMAMISLVEEDRQVFRAALGVEMKESPRDYSFCGHVILGSGAMVVEDAQKDPRFRHSPFVSSPLNVRFYAGAPIRVFGQNVGALCVIDRRARTLPHTKVMALEVLASLASSVIQAKHNRMQLESDLISQRVRAMACN